MSTNNKINNYIISLLFDVLVVVVLQKIKYKKYKHVLLKKKMNEIIIKKKKRWLYL